jgi:hypothetical protein
VRWLPAPVPERQDVHLAVALPYSKGEVVPDPRQVRSANLAFSSHRLPDQAGHVLETIEELVEILIERERGLVSIAEPPIPRRFDLRGGVRGNP